MPEPTTPTTPATSPTPQAGGGTTTPQPLAGATTPPEPLAGEGQSEQFSLEEARKLRSEAANLRKRMKAYEDAEQAAKDAQLSEVERLKKQQGDLQAQHETYVRQAQERIVRYEVERQAAKLGIIDTDAAAKLIDWAELEYDDDGTPKNAEKVLQALLKAKPYLAGQQQQQAGQGGTGTPAIPAMNPGRSTIQPPTTLPPGQIPRLSDVYRSNNRR